MNILTHPIHTGYQFDLAATGHQFYSLPIPETKEVFWDERSRPCPKNSPLLPSLAEAPVKFDLALVHLPKGFEQFQHLDIPIIYKEHCITPELVVPPNYRQRV